MADLSNVDEQGRTNGGRSPSGVSGEIVAEQMGGSGWRAVSPPESNDPFELVQMYIDVPADGDCYDRMARTFIEEYMMMGWTDDEILSLFHEPYYRGTHDILKNKGEVFVKSLIHEVRYGESI